MDTYNSFNADILSSFYKYLGPVNSLGGYERSYKLVFYKSYFESIKRGEITTTEHIATLFREYYINRIHQGKVPDLNVSRAVANPEESTVKDALDVILRNPFNVIQNKGFFKIEKQDGRECFQMVPKLAATITDAEIDKILDIVEQKLKLYYSSMDNGAKGKLREVIDKFLNGYVDAKKGAFTGSPFGTFVRSEIPNAIYNTGLVDPQNYLITGSVGQGNWATIPWICIFDRSITTTATKGVYIVYLLSKTGESLYLTFNQGCTDIKNAHGKQGAIKIMRERAAEIVARIDGRGFNTDEDIDLGQGLTDLGEMYQKGTIFYKEYKRGAVPSEAELQQDLSKMMDIYREYAGVKPKTVTDVTNGPKGEKDLSIKSDIEQIKKYIAAKGFSYNDGLIEDFYLSLKSKPFVILAGTSGTGKTRLVKLFAGAVGAYAKESGGNGRFKLVSVRPDWSDSTDLFGHTDLNGNYIPGAIIDFVKEAKENREYPYFLCLDEMNLSRVEYYLSDFLSLIETRTNVNGEIKTYKLTLDKAAEKDYPDLYIPENLYVIGTVNMDETTFPFSKKVLDRANTIEFSYVDLLPSFSSNAEAVAPLNKGNDFFKSQYLVLGTDVKPEQQELAKRVSADLQNINKVLQQANAHVGYRVRDEIVFFMLNNDTAKLLDYDTAFDYEIMQKILPRIQGSSEAIKNMICDLFKMFAGDYSGFSQSYIWKQMDDCINNKSCKYKNSAQKLCYMMRRFEEDGFTSYWL
ncbi:AAA domain (dynein-related subfamily) [Butyrivibrio proteoclasticus]|uniref:AAA domain (Dynein-related subfamily) n=1 Tax=Butyrivibrio proteoclasticus TaxID=43305 RepID=A0A1I5VI99_9FIRM|nr:DUF3578 domain-containing protein [Butyrivibrio proteoclasticus]SFQ07220.1 AAA domain (dynein-related subfamily) [Butyrivibrio proteoclasticus]